MKYLLLLLTLTACAPKTQKARQETASPAPEEPTVETDSLNLKAEKLANFGQIIETGENHIDIPDEFSEEGDGTYWFMADDDIAWYTKGRKYGKEYQEFFELQRISFGTNDKGRYRVDRLQFLNFKDKYPYQIIE